MTSFKITADLGAKIVEKWATLYEVTCQAGAFADGSFVSREGPIAPGCPAPRWFTTLVNAQAFAIMILRAPVGTALHDAFGYVHVYEFKMQYAHGRGPRKLVQSFDRINLTIPREEN